MKDTRLLMTLFDPLNIHSQFGDYSVRFEPDIASLQGALLQSLSDTQAIIIVDQNVYHAFEPALLPLLSQHAFLCIEATEAQKSWVGASQVIDFLQHHHATKKTHLIALGGGITQEIVGFAAQIYYRGLPWQIIPTTLLAMSDSCIGGKVAINHGPYKNQLGGFYPPEQVWICPDFLETLPLADKQSGLGEILKMMILGGANYVEGLQRYLKADPMLSGNGLMPFIRDSLLLKKTIVEADELEGHARQLLNYGHTFGHALETLTHHAVPHGIAVSWGCLVANNMAVRLGLGFPQEQADSIAQLVHTYFDWSSIPQGITAEDLITAMRFDKKAESTSTVRFILPHSIGNLQIKALPMEAVFRNTLQDVLVEIMRLDP
jgi:3-dehydroquinate synthase